MKKYIFIFAILGLLFWGCKKEPEQPTTVFNPCPDEPQFIYEGQTYQTVLIGNQC